jgi:hypothetical protein
MQPNLPIEMDTNMHSQLLPPSAGTMVDRNHASPIFRRPLDWLTKRLFLSAYEASDAFFWRHHGSHGRWRDLGGLLEYDPKFISLKPTGAPAVCLVSLRATGGATFKRVVLMIKVKRSGVILQERLCLDGLGSQPVRKALSIVSQRPDRPSGNPTRKLGEVYIKLVEAIDGEGADLANGKKIGEIFRPTCTDSPYQPYVRRWNRFWNIEEFNAEKQKLKNLWFQRLVKPAGQLGRPLTARRTVFRLLTNELALSLQFWSQNLSHARQLRGSLERSMYQGGRTTDTRAIAVPSEA